MNKPSGCLDCTLKYLDKMLFYSRYSSVTLSMLEKILFQLLRFALMIWFQLISFSIPSAFYRFFVTKPPKSTSLVSYAYTSRFSCGFSLLEYVLLASAYRLNLIHLCSDIKASADTLPFPMFSTNFSR